MNCELCNGTGLEPVFEHVSFPAYSPAQKQVHIEAFDFTRNERQWTEDGTVHQLLESFMICDCPSGQARETAMKKRQQSKSNNGRGWQPRQANKEAEVGSE